jgi:hypothetical protein
MVCAFPSTLSSMRLANVSSFFLFLRGHSPRLIHILSGFAAGSSMNLWDRGEVAKRKA